MENKDVKLSKIDILGSSSKGNAYILTFEDGVKYQLDAGVKNDDVDKIDKLFISHSLHYDHSRFIKDFDSKKVILESDKERMIDDWHSFVVPHIVLNNGYEIKRGCEDIVYITDNGNQWEIKQKFPNATYLFIEVNYDSFRIKQKVIKAEKHGEYAFSDKGHSGTLDTLNLIYRMNIPASCKIIFIHKSEHHTNENTFKIFDGLENKWVLAKKYMTIYCKSWKVV